MNRSAILGDTYQPTEVPSSRGISVLAHFLPSLPVADDEPQHSPGTPAAPRSVAVILTADRMHVKQKLLQRIVCTTPVQTHMPPPKAGTSIEPDAGAGPLALPDAGAALPALVPAHWHCPAEWRPHALQQKQEDTPAGVTLSLSRSHPAGHDHQLAQR